MKLRPFQRSDMPDLITIHSLTTLTDALGRFFYRDIDKYPTSYRLCHYLFIRNCVLEPGSIIWVVETDPSDYPSGISDAPHRPEVVGFAFYKRLGKSDKAKKWQAQNDGWSNWFDRGLVSWEDRYYNLFPSVRRVWNAANFAKVLPSLMTPLDPEVFAEVWRLNLLFVHPDWQRKGIGKLLLNWALQTAQSEQVPVVTRSSPKGGAAYRAIGFRSYGNMNMAAFYDETEFGGETSQMWVWEPKLDDQDGIDELRGRWWERAKANNEKAEQERLSRLLSSI